MATKEKPPPMVLVVWEDIRVTKPGESWVPKGEDDEYDPFLVNHVGFLIKDEPEYIRLTSAMERDFHSPHETIPRGCIREMYYLSKSRKRKPKE
jgi:hypothetical protein